MGHGEEPRRVVADLLHERNARRGRQQLRQTQHIVEMFAHVFGVHLGTLLPANVEVQPRDRFQRDQPIFTDPEQAIDFTTSRPDELVVGFIQQDATKDCQRLFALIAQCRVTLVGDAATDQKRPDWPKLLNAIAPISNQVGPIWTIWIEIRTHAIRRAEMNVGDVQQHCDQCVRKMLHISDFSGNVRNMRHTSDMPSAAVSTISGTDLRRRVLDRIASDPDAVWTPGDFADLASRAAVDKTLQRLEAAGELRRIDRGLYDRPSINNLTGRPTVPDYRAVIRAVASRDNARFVVDGMTAANDLGLTTAVPARIEVLVDARLKPIKLGNQEIHFKAAAPSRLFWASRPAMRVVQALHWMQDMLMAEDERARVTVALRRIFTDPQHGKPIREDLRDGLSSLPIWMQEFLRPLVVTDDTRAV